MCYQSSLELKNRLNKHPYMSNFEQYRCWWNCDISSSDDFKYFSPKLKEWQSCFILSPFELKTIFTCFKKYMAVYHASSLVMAYSTLLFLRAVFHLLFIHNTKLLPLEEDQKLCEGSYLKLVLDIRALCSLPVLEMWSEHPIFNFRHLVL